MLKKIELLANIAIIIVSLLLGVVLVKRYLLPGAQTAVPQPRPQIQAGTKMRLPGVEWAAGRQTLVLVLSDSCRYCTESAGFYQRLAREKARRGNPRLLAVLPQDVSRGQAYLAGLGFAADDVRQAALDTLGVRGTPTLLLVDATGTVQESWVGKLSPAKEVEMMNRLWGERASN